MAGPGRPRKKGKKSWKPATKLVTFNENPNYGYRFCRNEPSNLDKKQEEGWEFVNRTTDSSVSMDATDRQDPVTGGLKYRELVLMRMPRKDHPEGQDIESRTAYFDEITNRSERSAKDNLQKELSRGGKAEAYGQIIIE